MPDTKLSALPSGAAITDADLSYWDQSAASVRQPASALATYLQSKGLPIGSPIGSGTPGSVLFIGTGPVLAQDNANFFWDDTNFILKLGHAGTTAALYLNNLPAIFEVANVNGNNWFEGNAGNSTLTGFLNFGTGDGCLAALTTGNNNTGIGANAGLKITTGVGNIAVGFQALHETLLDSNNTALGATALNALGLAGAGSGNNNGNIGIGFGAMNQATTGSGNILIGFGSLQNVTGSADFNTIVGNQAGNALATGTITRNTFVGQGAGSLFTTASDLTFIGGYKGIATSKTHAIGLSDGGGQNLFDYNWTGTNVYSMNFNFLGSAVGLHIYNAQDVAGPNVTNYERAVLDWTITTNVFRIGSQSGGTGTVRIIAIDGFSKAGAPANTDLPSGTWALIDDTTNNQTWLVFNKGGTIRKVQLT